MTHDVFISYSSRDKPIADGICATMEQNGVRCWIAPRDIRPGADWGESIVHAIAGSKVFVLVLSHFANASQQIKREVERAVNRGLPIIPYRIEDVMPAESLEYFISTPHWLDAFTPPIEQHAQYLAETVKRILKEPLGDAAAAPMPPPRPVGGSPPWLKTMLLPLPMAVLVAGALTLAGLGAWAMRPPSFVGRWTAAKIDAPGLGAGGAYNPITLSELIGAALTGSAASGTFTVGTSGAYQSTFTAQDHGAVTGDGSELVFTSAGGASSRVSASVAPGMGGQLAAIGGQPGDAALILQGDGGKFQEIWVGQSDGPAAQGPMASFAGRWRNTMMSPTLGAPPWAGALTITAAGAYAMTLSETENGLWTASKGEWKKTTAPVQFAPAGATTSGQYKFHGRDKVTTTDSAGSMTWTRVG
jgi:hypothetical protein